MSFLGPFFSPAFPKETTMQREIWLVTLFSILAVAARAQEYTKDATETIQKNLAEKKAVLLDVRELSEWNAGHLRDAVLVPLSKLRAAKDPKEVLKDVDSKKIIYCHCRAGGRALTAAKLLKQQGYDVRPLKQGYEELMKAGLPKAADEKTDKK
jgi:rhodanese-related sulfurtransferase